MAKRKVKKLRGEQTQCDSLFANCLLQKNYLDSLDLSLDGYMHDLNNIIAVISGNVALIKMDTHPRRKETLNRLTAIEDAARRASELTYLLKNTGSDRVPVGAGVSISELITESVRLICAGTNVCCNVNITEPLSIVRVPVAQISRVFNNMFINACQAMPEGGNLSVTATNVESDAHLKTERCVRISISDQGEGIPKENLAKIFDPYFTTKEKGNGLGLAICDSIVRKYQGRIDVESLPGQGTTFDIYLPASF